MNRYLPLALVVPSCFLLSAAGCSDGGTSDQTGGTGAGAVGGSGAGIGGSAGTVAGTAGTPTGGTAGVGGVAGSLGAGTGGTLAGSAGLAGTSGAGGLGAAGSGAGTAGDAGASGLGGGSGASGAAGMAGAGGTGTPVTCTITQSSEISTKIATVGIVTWTSDLAGMDSAEIEFGLDTTYGMTAPIPQADLMASNRTLLLGMKPSKMYHYRVVAHAGASVCAGDDQTVMTGAKASNLPNISLTTTPGAQLSGGFLITGQYATSGGSSPAYIIDADGDFVWWYSINSDVTGARMSYDGKYMWINRGNVPESQGASVHRVSMDGLTDENLSSQFTGQNHQLTVLPDETIAFYAYNSNGCDDIKERSPAGMVKTIINAGTAHGAGGPCHVNTIQYSAEDDSYVFSDLDNDNYTKVTRSGTVKWVLGGSTSTFTGMGASWSRQHGCDILGLDRLLFFNNGSMGGGGGSLAIEVLLAGAAVGGQGADTATRAWTYTAMPSINNAIMGDVRAYAERQHHRRVLHAGRPARGRQGRQSPAGDQLAHRRRFRLHREAREPVRAAPQVTPSSCRRAAGTRESV